MACAEFPSTVIFSVRHKKLKSDLGSSAAAGEYRLSYNKKSRGWVVFKFSGTEGLLGKKKKGISKVLQRKGCSVG